MDDFRCKNYVVERVESAIDKGHRGRAYKARRASDGAVCAIKELDVRHMTEEEKEDLSEEIRVLATVHSENLIRYYDVLQEGEQMFVVTEYREEADLRGLMKARAEQQRFFSESQVWSFLIQVYEDTPNRPGYCPSNLVSPIAYGSHMLRGLVALHSKGLIHRNVRSSNILHVDGSTVKLGDVGVGKLKEGTAATQIGDPHYIPPEVWENKAYTFKGDVWAVGCVLYEIITLSLPFGGCSLPELRRKVIQGSYQPLPSSFSSGLTKVLKLLFNPDEAMRISAQDMLAHAVLQGHVQRAPAPAAILRVQSSDKDYEVEPIQVNPSILVQPHMSFPASIAPPDEEYSSGHTSESDQTQARSTSPPSRTLQGVGADARPAAASFSGGSKGLSLLAPRAILSSPDNDRMLSGMDVRRNRQAAATRLTVPRVAMLSKVTQKSSPSEKPSVKSPAGKPIADSPAAPLSRVNVKHFKTAYIQNPTAVSEESTAVKSEAFTPPPPPPLPRSMPRRTKSSDSVRSSATSSSNSDESSFRVRAPFDEEDEAHATAEPAGRERSLYSDISVASSPTEESAAGGTAPVATSVKSNSVIDASVTTTGEMGPNADNQFPEWRPSIRSVANDSASDIVMEKANSSVENGTHEEARDVPVHTRVELSDAADRPKDGSLGTEVPIISGRQLERSGLDPAVQPAAGRAINSRGKCGSNPAQKSRPVNGLDGLDRKSVLGQSGTQVVSAAERTEGPLRPLTWAKNRRLSANVIPPLAHKKSDGKGALGTLSSQASTRRKDAESVAVAQRSQRACTERSVSSEAATITNISDGKEDFNPATCLPAAQRRSAAGPKRGSLNQLKSVETGRWHNRRP